MKVVYVNPYGWTDDEIDILRSISHEASRICQVNPSQEEQNNAKSIFIYLNTEIEPMLKNCNSPLAILGFDNLGEFDFAIGSTNRRTTLPCSYGTLIALKDIYNKTFSSECTADISCFPSRTPGYGIKTAITIIYGSK